MLFEKAESAHSTSVKSELSPSGVAIEQVNKQNQVVSLPSTALPLMADVKLEGLLGKTANGSVIELRSAGGNAYEQLQIYMKSVCMVNNSPVGRLLEAMDQSCKDVIKVMHCLICHPMYNNRWIVERSELTYVRLSF